MTDSSGSKESRPAPADAGPAEAPTDVHGLSAEKQVEHLAGLQFTQAEVARVVGEPVAGDLLTAYERGRLLEEAKVREAMKRLAIRGSSPAQKQYQDLAADTKKSNRRQERKRSASSD